MGRRQLNVSVDAEAYAGWQDFTDSRGITMTGLVQALGETMALLVQGDVELPELGEDVVVRAREIDTARRRRPRTIDLSDEAQVATDEVER